MDVATSPIITHSENSNGTVRSIFWRTGLYTASIWNTTTSAVAAMRNLLEKISIRNIDLLSERQFHALNHWNTASVVSETVHAFAKSASKYPWKRNRVPNAIGSAISTMRRAMSPSTIYLLGFLNALERSPSSFGSIASATSRNPSVTKLSQIICAARTGRGYPSNNAPVITNTSPRLVENRYKITFFMVL